MSIYDNAGVVLIPSGTKASKLYSVLPDNGNGDFTHSRGSTATRVNIDGLIESVATNVPRLDYPLIDGVVQDCPHLLLEPQRINLVEYSESFNSWGNGSSYATANQVISPDGNLTADRLSKTAAFQQVYESATTVIGSTYSFSIFAKKNTLDRITLRIAGGGYDVRKCLDLNDLTIVSGGGNQTGFVEGKVEQYTNDWYRFTVIATVNTTAPALNVYAGKDSVTESGNIYIWGAQFELGNYSTSYIPNLSTGTTTRSADACFESGTSADFNSEEGVVFLEIKPIALDGTYKRIVLSDATLTNRIIMGFDNSNNVQATIYNGADQAIMGGNYAGKEDVQKVALKYKVNDFSLYFNGFKVASDSSGTTFGSNTLNEFEFRDSNSTNTFYGIAKQIWTFKTALTDSELETLTSWDSFNAMAKGQLYTIE